VLCVVTMNEVGNVFKTLVKDIETCNALESGSTQKAKRESSSEFRINDVMSTVKSTVEHCNQARKRVHANTSIDISDTRLSKLAKFTDEMALKHFETFLQYVPRLVNVVTVRACTITMPHPTPCTKYQASFGMLFAVGRSIPSAWQQPKTPTRPKLHCESVHGCLLCTKTLFGSAVGVHESEGESANLPYVLLSNSTLTMHRFSQSLVCTRRYRSTGWHR